MQKRFTLFGAVFLLAISAFSQWTQVAETTLRLTKTKRVISPQQYKVFQLNHISLNQQLVAAPKEFSQGAGVANTNILLLPMPDGSLQRFQVFNSPIMEEGLQKKYPEIQTYSGQGLDDPTASVRIDWNPYSGFHARILSSRGDVYIDPFHQGNTVFYQAYYQRDFTSPKQFAELPVRHVPGRAQARISRTAASAPCRGNQLFTYRAAVSCTGEYARAVTGSMTPTKAATLAAIVTSVNRVSQVYERDLAIRLILIANNDVIVYTDPATDPYDGNNDGGTLLDESRDTIPAKIGVANFDIGHTFSTGGGGVAYLGVVCDNDYKAGGVTGSSNPVGDPYDIDYVAHEMGHQFGGDHTFRGANGSCAGNGAYGPPLSGGFAAYEPGSGTTIQAYAGICITDDIQPNSDPYFHSVSYDQIVNYVTSGLGGSCKGVINTGNAIPVITAMNFNGVSIPVATPFTLSASATDANGDPLTYSWEQWDVALTPAAYNDANGYADGNAIWRSRVPTTDGKRTIPDIRYVAANYMPAAPPSQMNGLRGEVLPTVTKSYSFRLTVRDNKAGGGGVATGGGKPVDPITGAGGVGCSFTTPFSINVTPGTFAVTSPNGGESYNGGTLQTVTWLNAGTTVAPINCQTVNITLSTDGGLTYPITVVNSTPNDGSQQVIIPNVSPSTATARLRIEATDNIFFDISNANFSIQNVNAPLPVSIKEFTVKPQGKNAALLSWTTAQEAGNRGFEIERSIGNENSYHVIAFRQATNEAAGSSYSFINENLPLNTNIYYRLKQVDASGESRLSVTRIVRFNERGFYIAIGPNPAKDFITINNNGQAIAAAGIQIFDGGGRLVRRLNTNLENITRLNIASLAKGVYSISIRTATEEVYAGKFVKE